MITQHHGDNLAILPTLAPCSIQALITSPPYFGLRSYAIPPSDWPEIAYCPLIGLPPVVIPAMQCQLGAEPDPLAYIGHLVHVFRLARPALRRDGSLWVNLGDSLDEKQLLGIPHRAALALQADGWVWRSDVVWHKPSGMPESVKDRPTRAHEQILLFGVGPRYYYDAEAVAEEGSGNDDRPQLKRARELVNQHGLSQAHIDAIRASGATDVGRGAAVQSGTGKNTDEVQRLAAEAKQALGGYYREFLLAPTRNRRSVWSIATAPMPTKLRGTDDAHYAAWPPALVEIMVKASSANKACAACGAAWVRQVEREQRPRGDAFGKKQIGKDFDHGQGGRAYMETIAVRTTGFTPACACAAGVGRCVILDCFAGTGTTMSVCESLGRDSIGIDLGYQELQSKRTDNLQIAMEAFI